MKKLVTLLLLSLLFLQLPAQTPAWLWGRSGKGLMGNDYAYDVCTDAAGNMYAVGTFNSPLLKFASLTYPNTNNNMTNDLFVVKFNATGTMLWFRIVGGDDNDEGTSIAVDAGGNVYVGGSFSSDTLTFGSSTLVNQFYNPQFDLSDAFVAKYDSNGNALWAKSFGGTQQEKTGDLAIDTMGNVIVAGYFESATLTTGSTVLTSNGYWDIFLAKFTPAGSLLWAKNEGGGGMDKALSIVSDQNNDFYLAGSFVSPAITFGSTTLTNVSNDEDLFLVKYDAVGNVYWARSAGGSAEDIATAVTVDASGNPVLTGTFTSPTIVFGSTTLTRIPNQAIAAPDIFLAKYDAAGNPAWARSGGGIGADAATGVACSSSGQLFISGYFTDTVAFDLVVIPPTGFSSLLFIAFDMYGTAVWAEAKTAGGDDYGFDLAADATGNVFYVGSYYSYDLAFGPDTLHGFPASAGNDVFLAKLYDGGIIMPGIPEMTNQNELTIYPNPGTGVFVIAGETADQQVYVYNAIGQEIYQAQHTAAAIKLDLSDQPKGMYLVKLVSEGTIRTGKIIVE